MSVIGKTLGHYQITNQIGRGGMGEVYQAKDQKLGRDVAIKVLPEEFAKDADRVARFQREAKLLASLNHPNIAAIHGLEESDGTKFLVLELVEGETLADRIKAGPLPVEESLKLALQIAEALEAAHEKGVIHRDLKPANIKVTPDGKVKVLDFGLAKAFAGDQANLNLSNSPTLSNAATQQGVILGTAAYMSPEQARGKAVDKRADIWAFGCVLYEMLTGRQTWTGATVTDIIAAALAKDPDFGSLPQNLHPRIRLLLERCLEKEARDRYHDIADVRVDIQKVLADPSGVLVQPLTTVEPRTRLRTILPWATATLVLGLIIAGVIVWKLKTPEPRLVTRFDYELPEGQQFSYLGQPFLAVSNDGRKIAYTTNQGLYLLSLDQFDAKPVPGTDEAPRQPFFSPDGQWLGYWSQRSQQLKKISVTGGNPIPITDRCPTGSVIWQSDDTILYAQEGGGIIQISANGGIPTTLIESKYESFFHPRFLQNGASLIFTFGSSPYKIAVQSLKSGKRQDLFQGHYAQYLSTGHLVFVDGNTLYGTPFNPDNLTLTGSPIPVVPDVLVNGGTGAPEYALSSSGTLAYVPQSATDDSVKRTLVWVDRNGKEEPLDAPPMDYCEDMSSPKISPDGKRVALTVNTKGNLDIYIYDLLRKNPERLTTDPGRDSWPLWTPDSKKVVYCSSRGTVNYDINMRAADGSGEVVKLGSLPNSPSPFCFIGNDEKNLLSWEGSFQMDIVMLSFNNGGFARKPLLAQKYNEDHPQISPNGKWLAYASNESGRNEVYVRPFPDVNKGRWQISQNGGYGPLWSPKDGREIFYRNGESVMAVAVETEPNFSPGIPKEIFKGKYFSDSYNSSMQPMWDISRQDKRFLMVKEPSPASADGGPRKINIVLNWTEELKQRVPGK